MQSIRMRKTLECELLSLSISADKAHSAFPSAPKRLLDLVVRRDGSV